MARLLTARHRVGRIAGRIDWFAVLLLAGMVAMTTYDGNAAILCRGLFAVPLFWLGLVEEQTVMDFAVHGGLWSF